MRRLIIGALVLGSWVIAPATATAQARVPHAESSSIGVDLGAFRPSGNRLENAPMIGGFYEYYVTPRISLRPSIAWYDSDIGSGIDSVRQVPIRADLNYNWEGGKWHPFVGTGLGVYIMQLRHSGQSAGDSENKLGLDLGGGVEYFFHRTASFKGEGRYYAVNDFRGIEPSGFVFSAGLKTYF